MSCSSNGNEEINEKEISLNLDNTKGLSLINSNNCLSCHKVDEKLTGPSYKEIAAKYSNTAENVEMLSKKIINGGQGNWGAIAMPAQPNITKSDANEMIIYILSLKKD